MRLRKGRGSEILATRANLPGLRKKNLSKDIFEGFENRYWIKEKKIRVQY